MKDPTNLIITGVGGQGNILASQITASAGIKCGFMVSIGETYGASQRGGSVMSHVRFSKSIQLGPLIPQGDADIVLGFEPLETLRVLLDYGNEKTRVVFNPRPNYPLSVLSGQFQYPSQKLLEEKIKELSAEAKPVLATELARDVGSLLVQNVVMVGALAKSGWLDIPQEKFEEVIEELFEDKAKREFNLLAFRAGLKGYEQAKLL